MASAWKPYEKASVDIPAVWFLGPCWRSLSAYIYRVRWSCIYPLQRRVCWLGPQNAWLTYGELILVLPVIGALIVLPVMRYDDWNATGRYPDIAVALTFSTAAHNSIWTFLLGIPFERALRYHKLFALLLTIMGIFHGVGCYSFSKIAGYKSKSYGTGWAFEGSMLLLCCLSIAPIRRRCFEVFYGTHIVLFLTVIVSGPMHGAQWMTIGVGAWALDVLIRYLYMAAVRYTLPAGAAELTALPADVIQLRFPRKTCDNPSGVAFDFKGGQYVFLCVPELSLFEWHPFSISSSPGLPDVSLHIRVLGNWTQRLYSLAERNQHPRILIEGPVGSPAVDLDSDRYKCVLCISGGIGITPMQSITNDLLEQHARGRPLKSISFIWAVRDRAMLGAIKAASQQQDSLQQLRDMDNGKPDLTPDVRRLPISFQPDLLSHNMALGPHLSDTVKHVSGTQPERPHLSDAPAPAPALLGVQQESVVQDPPAEHEGVLHSEFFLTQVRSKDEWDAAGIAPDEQACVRFGRPDLGAAFERMRAVALAAGEVRVAALVCGPEAMVREVRGLCREYTSKGSVAFDYHAEEFEY